MWYNTSTHAFQQHRIRTWFEYEATTLNIDEAYKILNLDRSKKITKDDVKKAHAKIQKKIHPDISPETTRLSSLVNEAKEIVLKDIT